MAEDADFAFGTPAALAANGHVDCTHHIAPSSSHSTSSCEVATFKL
jgi:hypothetical protein